MSFQMSTSKDGNNVYIIAQKRNKKNDRKVIVNNKQFFST